MTEIRSLEGYLVDPVRAREIAAPAYDALTEEERAAYAASHPDNFLTVLPAADAYGEAVLEAARRRLDELVADGAFAPVDAPFLAIYRLEQEGHAQTGVVADLPLSVVDRGELLAHEATRPDREDHIVAFLERVGVSSSPVALTYRSDPGVDAAVARAVDAPPTLDLTADDGLRQLVWLVTDPDGIRDLTGAFASVGRVYITDGHHRSAALIRYADERGAATRGPGGDGILVALFPDREMALYEYNLMVVTPEGVDPDATVLALQRRGFSVRPAPAATPQRRQIGMGLGGGWFVVDLPDRERDDTPLGALDVTNLHREILRPLFGITDPRSDPRLRHVPGIVPVRQLHERAQAAGGAAFALHPPTLADLMAVADAGQVMPPKSTFFAPKVRSGLFLKFH